MGEGEEPGVVPIRPGAHITHERSLQLLAHVADRLSTFAMDNDGEEPLDIVFVIVGKDGTARSGHMVDKRWRSTTSLASVLLAHDAMAAD